MRSAYATWQHSSHRAVAGCNDCHVPQDNVLSKYYFKAKDGLRHATIFTMRAEPQVIKMHADGHYYDTKFMLGSIMILCIVLAGVSVKVMTIRPCTQCLRSLALGAVGLIFATVYFIRAFSENKNI